MSGFKVTVQERRTWYGPQWVNNVRAACEQAVDEANGEALEWAQGESPVVTGEFQQSWYSIGPVATAKGTGGGIGNSAPYATYVDNGWSGFEGYHIAERAMQMFYSDMLARIKSHL